MATQPLVQAPRYMDARGWTLGIVGVVIALASMRPGFGPLGSFFGIACLIGGSRLKRQAARPRSTLQSLACFGIYCALLLACAFAFLGGLSPAGP